LAVSCELGTNPDINTVNVNNRVQTVISQLPQEVQLQGIKVQKKSSSILQFVNLYDESGKYDPLFITNFAIINVLDELSRTPGVGEAKLFGGVNYSLRRKGQTVCGAQFLEADLVRPGSLGKPQCCPIRHHQGHPKPECSGVDRPHRRTADSGKSADSGECADAGAAGRSRSVWRHRAARQR